MTLEQASESAGVSAPHVSRIERAQGAYAGTSPLLILGFTGEDDVVYLETLAGSIYPETEIAYYRDTFTRIQQDASSCGNATAGWRCATPRIRVVRFSAWDRRLSPCSSLT